LRIAALAFGVIAGLIASLILALGGLDVALVGASADRQMQVTRFGLFVIANLGVFGAGLVLASPLGGAVLFAIGAVAWVVSALLLHHGVDLVLIVPPALLLVATALSVVAFFRRGRPITVPPLRLGRRSRAPEPQEFDDLPSVPVGAGFFGEGGTAQPLRSNTEPNVGGLDERDRPPLDWAPGKRRQPPPRQKPMFRPPDDEIEESGFSRIARGISSVLSFGLYAGVAAAVILVFWNARTIEPAHPAAAKLEPAPAISSVAKPVPEIAAQPSLVAVVPAAAPASSAQPQIPAALMNGVVVADDPSPQVTFEAPTNILDAGGPSVQTGAAPQLAPADSQQDVAAGDVAAPADSGDVVMPFPMPPEIAATRSGPSSRPPRAAAPAQPINSTGL
jgi:hypothetical protein